VGRERGPLSLVGTIEELLERKCRGPAALCDTPLSAKARTNFADKQRSLDRYSSFVDSGHGFVFLHVSSPSQKS
jgi:hypothetical protein